MTYQKGNALLILVIFLCITIFLTSGIYLLVSADKSHPLSNPLVKIISPNLLPASSAKPTTKSPPQISLDRIFTYTDPGKISKNDLDQYTIIATGDVIPARSVNSKVVRLDNFKYPFEKTADFLKSADAVFINLESPLIPNCPLTDEGMIFCGDLRNIEGLKFAGVTVASIANNHAGNHGSDGVNYTTALLEKNRIQVTGNGNPAVLTIRDKKFGFLGYNDIGHQEPGISWAKEETIQKEIQTLRPQVDFLIVTFHWGIEYTPVPNQRQRDLAHLAIDSGADLIIGNHPHWVQGVEKYQDKFITYAHGNFVFDQEWSQKTREGVLGKYTFNKNSLEDVKFYPVIIENYAQPRFATKAEAIRILDEMKQSTLSIQKKP
ncbi:CapA family protein [Candidatus Daviesbacteria bacterium]|nr:CapA family protein [Candidatus Daviesbacteria bacterium]